MSRSKKGKTGENLLNLLDSPRTWFHWNEQEHNVKDAPAEVFDAWIRQYVDQIVDIDVSTWEIFHRWGIINACINGQFLVLCAREDGSQVLEEKPSDLESLPEEKSSELMEA